MAEFHDSCSMVIEMFMSCCFLVSRDVCKFDCFSELYRALTYSLTPFVPGNVHVVGNNRSTGSRGLCPIIKKYGEYPVICDLVEL